MSTSSDYDLFGSPVPSRDSSPAPPSPRPGPQLALPARSQLALPPRPPQAGEVQHHHDLPTPATRLESASNQQRGAAGAPNANSRLVLPPRRPQAGEAQQQDSLPKAATTSLGNAPNANSRLALPPRRMPDDGAQQPDGTSTGATSLESATGVEESPSQQPAASTAAPTVPIPSTPVPVQGSQPVDDPSSSSTSLESGPLDEESDRLDGEITALGLSVDRQRVQVLAYRERLETERAPEPRPELPMVSSREVGRPVGPNLVVAEALKSLGVKRRSWEDAPKAENVGWVPRVETGVTKRKKRTSEEKAEDDELEAMRKALKADETALEKLKKEKRTLPERRASEERKRKRDSRNEERAARGLPPKRRRTPEKKGSSRDDPIPIGDDEEVVDLTSPSSPQQSSPQLQGESSNFSSAQAQIDLAGLDSGSSSFAFPQQFQPQLLGGPYSAWPGQQQSALANQEDEDLSRLFPSLPSQQYPTLLLGNTFDNSPAQEQASAFRPGADQYQSLTQDLGTGDFQVGPMESSFSQQDDFNLDAGLYEGLDTADLGLGSDYNVIFGEDAPPLEQQDVPAPVAGDWMDQGLGQDPTGFDQDFATKTLTQQGGQLVHQSPPQVDEDLDGFVEGTMDDVWADVQQGDMLFVNQGNMPSQQTPTTPAYSPPNMGPFDPAFGHYQPYMPAYETMPAATSDQGGFFMSGALPPPPPQQQAAQPSGHFPHFAAVMKNPPPPTVNGIPVAPPPQQPQLHRMTQADFLQTGMTWQDSVINSIPAQRLCPLGQAQVLQQQQQQQGVTSQHWAVPRRPRNPRGQGARPRARQAPHPSWAAHSTHPLAPAMTSMRAQGQSNRQVASWANSQQLQQQQQRPPQQPGQP